MNDRVDNWTNRSDRFQDIPRDNYDVHIRSLTTKGNFNGDRSSILNSTADSHPCNEVDFNLSHCQSIVQEFTASDHWFSFTTELLVILLYCVAIVLGILGNALVCYAVIKFKHQHKPRNFLILNLSICGIIMCVFCMPFSLIRILLKNWHLGEFLCRFSPTLQTLDVLVSTFTIVVIAVDRYSVIVCAIREETKRRLVCYSIFVIWMASIFLCVPMMVFNEVQDIYPENMNVKLYKVCLEVWPSDVWKKLYTTCILLIQYIVPVAMISFLHGRICQYLRVRINISHRSERETTRILRDVKRHRKNMILLTAIAVSFAITWLPLTVLNTLADYDYELLLNKKFNHAYAYSLLAAMCSAFLNPLIYGWFNSNFRKTVLQLICSKRYPLTESTERATIKNDSRENSNPPYRFYSSLQLQPCSNVEQCKSISNKSSSPEGSFHRSKSSSSKSIHSMHAFDTTQSEP